MLHHRGFFAGRHYSEEKEEEEDKKERKKNECSKKVLSDMRFRPHDPPFLYAAARKRNCAVNRVHFHSTLLRIMSLGGRSILLTRPHVCLRVLCRL